MYYLHKFMYKSCGARSGESFFFFIFFLPNDGFSDYECKELRKYNKLKQSQ